MLFIFNFFYIREKLPQNLKMEIIKWMDVRSIVKMSQINKAWYLICNHQTIWKFKYIFTFDDIPLRSNDSDFPWKEKFILKYQVDCKHLFFFFFNSYYSFKHPFFISLIIILCISSLNHSTFYFILFMILFILFMIDDSFHLIYD